MRLLAIGAAFQLPHDRKALAFLVRAFQIVGEFEEAFQEPWLLVEPVVGQHRRGARRSASSRQAMPRRSAGFAVSSWVDLSGKPRWANGLAALPRAAYILDPYISSRQNPVKIDAGQPCPRRMPRARLAGGPGHGRRSRRLQRRGGTGRNRITGWRSAICAPAISIWPCSKSTACAKPGACLSNASPASGRTPSTAIALYGTLMLTSVNARLVAVDLMIKMGQTGRGAPIARGHPRRSLRLAQEPPASWCWPTACATPIPPWTR